MAWPSRSAVPSASEGKTAAQRPGAGQAGLAGGMCTTGKPASAPMAALSAGAGGAVSCGPLPRVSSGGNTSALEGRHHVCPSGLGTYRSRFQGGSLGVGMAAGTPPRCL